jgi:mono/diheme cytochrome c family protein
MIRQLAIFVLLATAQVNAALAPPATLPGNDTAAGRVLLGEMNCTACHAATKEQSAWITPKAAPRLNDIGNRLSPEWIAKYLAAPHEVSPGVTMPDLLGALPAADRPAAAEALTHFLLSQSPPKARPQLPDRAAVRRGESLFHKIGCVACHAPQDGKPAPAASVPLTNLSAKWRFEGLRRFLRDPLSVRPSGRMPAMNLSDAEAADLAHFLLRDTQVPANLEVSHFRGQIRSLEDLDSAEPNRTGPAKDFSIEDAGRDRGGAARFAGWLLVDQPGDYTLFLTSIGPSRLAIDGKWLLGEESWERQRVNGRTKLRLEPGPHAIAVDFAPRGQKEPSLKVEWEGPGFPRQAIPPAKLRNTKDAVSPPATFALDVEKAAKGREIYAQLNCAVCHENKPAATPSPSLAALDPARGCLAEKPSAKSADFHLTQPQRTALQAAVADLKKPGIAAPSPREQLAHTLATFRCTACHSRDGVGGVPTDRDAYFTSAGEDLGDEGRLPPRLDGVGNKLRRDAIADVLFKAAAVRPYLNTRMPQFGDANISGLPDLFVAIDRQAVEIKPSSDPPDVQREIGRKLIGTDGLSCVACHRFNRQPSQTMQVVDLIATTDRLNEDWFRQFLIDPNKFHPGTRMPSFFPDGKSPLTKVLDGDTARQQGAMWTYLSDRDLAKFPAGLGRQNVELVVGGEAVVYRGKLWEAGFRAIAMGYPGQFNAAFDAEECRLALLWRGRFLNAGPHWTVQGMGQIRPLGTDVVAFPHGSAFAILADKNVSWPETPPRELGLKFRGYQLNDSNQPTLLYSFKDVHVEDFFTPLGGKSMAIRRTITFLEPPPENLHMRLAVGQLTAGRDHTWRFNQTVTIRVNGATATVRGDGEKRELIIAIPAIKKGQQVEVDYAW